ncbi:sigma-70 family RNA polymerase sigma factor [Microbacterium sp. NPDC089987]|uniref:sigma-70 family RNA polymerase sigma factor n=1 Tax=Microbacterium sp. NPDC089987 TaxID=3364202 RepID=UPI0037F6D5CA
MAIRDTSSQVAADVDLVLRTRSGDADAFGELWRRHHASGMVVARSVTSSIDPGDLVQEAYSRIYQAILKGGGPNGSFRAYLFTSIRNTAAASAAGALDSTGDGIETGPAPWSTGASPDEALDRELTAQAFRSLPSRWQEVLWYSEVEQMKPSEIATLLGMSAGAVAQLDFRAREGLREAWFQAHLRSAGQGSDCHWTVENLGAHTRGDLSTRARQRVDDHLESCTRCMILAAEAQDVADQLPLVLLPLVLGVSGGGAYLAMLRSGSPGSGSMQSGSAASSPMPSDSAPSEPVPMPRSVVSGAADASDATALHGDGASAAASGRSTGSVLGIGALIGAGSVALVVAGVVAAAAVVPTLISGAPSTSRPNAADPASSSIASEVAPDESMNTDKPMVIRVDDEQPAPEPRAPLAPAPAVPKAPRPVAPVPVAAPEWVRPAPIPTPAAPAPEPSPEPGGTPTPSPEPTPAPEPTPTPTPDPTPTPGDGSAAGDESRPGEGTAPENDVVGGDESVLASGPLGPADENPLTEAAE